MMVGARGFEPPTLWSQTRCAARLRYAPSLIFKLNRISQAVLKSKKTRGLPLSFVYSRYSFRFVGP